MVTFGTQTASSTKPDSRGIYDFGSNPGGIVDDHIAVINYSEQTIVLLLRGTDAVNTPQGGFSALPINDRSTGVGTWIELPSNELSVTLPPRTDFIVPFRVTIPKNAIPGDHVGVITATLVSSVVSKSGQRVHLLQTVGTRVFIRVTGPIYPRLAVKGLKVHYHGTANPIGTGRAVFTYTVENTGNVAVGGRQKVYVTGLFGSKRTAVRVAEIQLLLPGFSVKESVTVDHVVPEIRDTAHVSISLLYIPGSVQPKSGPFTASVGFWAVPWTLIAIVVGIVLIIAVYIIRRRRRRARRSRLTDGTGGPPSQSAGQDKPETASAADEDQAASLELGTPAPVTD